MMKEHTTGIWWFIFILIVLFYVLVLCTLGCGIGLPGYEPLYWEVRSLPAPGKVIVSVQRGSTSAEPQFMRWTIPMGEWRELKVGETGTRYVETLPELKGPEK